MRYRTRRKVVVGWTHFGPGLIGTSLAVIAAFGMLVSNLAAQQPGGKPQRINRIIEQFEQGKPAFANEHWTFFTLTNSPFLLPEFQKHLASLKVQGARPKMTPIVRIAQWGGQDFSDVIKQMLSQGVGGIIVPEVHTAEQAAKLVRSMRYPPQRGAKYPTPVGDRGCCPTAPGDAPGYWGLSLHDYFVRADTWPLNPDGELLAIVMVESRRGHQEHQRNSERTRAWRRAGRSARSQPVPWGRTPGIQSGGARSRGGDRHGGQGVRSAQGALRDVQHVAERRRLARDGVQAIPVRTYLVSDNTLTNARFQTG